MCRIVRRAANAFHPAKCAIGRLADSMVGTRRHIVEALLIAPPPWRRNGFAGEVASPQEMAPFLQPERG
ncbi:hypothetical protein [Tsuneonella suprasediminis]|uniref:hypothetical protein n=1 Tax=Tsuneonella suprasediminis TaxID=2306996 RepID=UPI0014024B07|nr:hypothetical protein [Tsuneonella suprasediminis]